MFNTSGQMGELGLVNSITYYVINMQMCNKNLLWILVK